MAKNKSGMAIIVVVVLLLVGSFFIFNGGSLGKTPLGSSTGDSELDTVLDDVDSLEEADIDTEELSDLGDDFGDL